jgi:hypothetical protein
MRERARRQPALGGGGPAFNVLRLAGQHLQEGSLRDDQRISVDQSLVFEPLEPSAGGLGASAGVGGKGEAFDQPGDPVGIPGGLGMADGQLRQTVGFAPGRRPSLEVPDQLGVALVQLGLEQVVEQVVVVVPLAVPAQRHAQHMGARQRLQGATRPPGVPGGVVERPGGAVEQSGSTVAGGETCSWIPRAHDSPSWRPWPPPQLRPNRMITGDRSEIIGRGTQARRDR